METTEQLQVFEVGGCIRDEIMGLHTKDVDFAVEAPSFDAMVRFVENEGHRVVDTRPEFLTVRAVVGKTHPLRERTNAADFVMCRRDSDTGDGRRPDFVTPGTIHDDLARRDFTVNAIARDVETGEIFDPFDGREDIRSGVLRFVGNPADRIGEDGLRVLRALRFAVTKGFSFHGETLEALRSDHAATMLAGDNVSMDTMTIEVSRAFEHDTMRALEVFGMFPNLTGAIFRDGLHLTGSRKKVKG
jgi:tRNA nucleotidyltransferase (CCA-adding enzyme)